MPHSINVEIRHSWSPARLTVTSPNCRPYSEISARAERRHSASRPMSGYNDIVFEDKARNISPPMFTTPIEAQRAARSSRHNALPARSNGATGRATDGTISPTKNGAAWYKQDETPDRSPKSQPPPLAAPIPEPIKKAPNPVPVTTEPTRVTTKPESKHVPIPSVAVANKENVAPPATARSTRKR